MLVSGGCPSSTSAQGLVEVIPRQLTASARAAGRSLASITRLATAVSSTARRENACVYPPTSRRASARTSHPGSRSSKGASQAAQVPSSKRDESFNPPPGTSREFGKARAPLALHPYIAECWGGSTSHRPRQALRDDLRDLRRARRARPYWRAVYSTPCSARRQPRARGLPPLLTSGGSRWQHGLGRVCPTRSHQGAGVGPRLQLGGARPAWPRSSPAALTSSSSPPHPLG